MDQRGLRAGSRSAGIEARQPQSIQLVQALVDQGPIIGRDSEQARAAPWNQVGRWHSYGTSRNDQSGTRWPRNPEVANLSWNPAQVPSVTSAAHGNEPGRTGVESGVLKFSALQIDNIDPEFST